MKRNNIILIILVIILGLVIYLQKSFSNPSQLGSNIVNTQTKPDSQSNNQSQEPSINTPESTKENPTQVNTTAETTTENTKPTFNPLAILQRLARPKTDTRTLTKTNTNLPTPPVAPTPTPAPRQKEFTPPKQSFTLEADDAGLYPTETLNVQKGLLVELTFTVRAAHSYYAGLDFRSMEFATGPILPGTSKTVEFTANQSFDFVAYWPDTYTKKYSGRINVTP